MIDWDILTLICFQLAREHSSLVRNTVSRPTASYAFRVSSVRAVAWCCCDHGMDTLRPPPPLLPTSPPSWDSSHCLQRPCGTEQLSSSLTPHNTGKSMHTDNCLSITTIPFFSALARLSPSLVQPFSLGCNLLAFCKFGGQQTDTKEESLNSLMTCCPNFMVVSRFASLLTSSSYIKTRKKVHLDPKELSQNLRSDNLTYTHRQIRTHFIQRLTRFIYVWINYKNLFFFGDMRTSFRANSSAQISARLSSEMGVHWCWWVTNHKWSKHPDSQKINKTHFLKQCPVK